jgi:hypothetical protein
MNPLLKEIKEHNGLIKTMEEQYSEIIPSTKILRTQIDDLNKILDPLYFKTWCGREELSEDDIKSIMVHQKKRKTIQAVYDLRLVEMQKMSDDIATKKLYIKKLYNELNDLLVNAQI